MSLRALTAKHGALLVINDRIDVARAVGADAANLGWRSLDIKAARKAAGEGLAPGFSAHNVVELRGAIRAHADYVIYGPVFDTPSKHGQVRTVGVEQLNAMSVMSPIPLIGIGGINIANASQVRQTRAAGLAVMRAVLESEDPGQVARQLGAAGRRRFFEGQNTPPGGTRL